MEGHYGQPITPYGAYNPYGQPPMIPPESMQPRLHHLQTMSSESLGTYQTEYDDVANAMLHPHTSAPQAPTQTRRRRQTHGADHIKHRRTRSGCFTCRSRRVKVIDHRGILERRTCSDRHCSAMKDDQLASVSLMIAFHPEYLCMLTHDRLPERQTRVRVSRSSIIVQVRAGQHTIETFARRQQLRALRR